MEIRKSEVEEAFGGVTHAARAMECSRRAVQYWPETLPIDWADRALGAMIRLGSVPDRLKPEIRAALRK